jgi:hypothetical protein
MAHFQMMMVTDVGMHGGSQANHDGLAQFLRERGWDPESVVPADPCGSSVSGSSDSSRGDTVAYALGMDSRHLCEALVQARALSWRLVGSVVTCAFVAALLLTTS